MCVICVKRVPQIATRVFRYRLTRVRHWDMVSPMRGDEELLTSLQASELLVRSVRTVHRLAQAGALPVAKKLPGPNGAYLFRRGDVLTLRESTRSAGAA